MSVTVYIISSIIVFLFSGLLAMAGIGAAFLFVPLFYYLGVPLAEATPTALLLNVVSLMFAAFNYWRGKLINWRVGFPVLVAAVVLSPLGARLTPYVDKTILLTLFAGFMMLFYHAKKREQALSAHVVTTDQKLTDGNGVMAELKARLAKFGIQHTTIQFECEACGQGAHLSTAEI